MKILVGISGGISAYKSADLILGLQKTGHEVRVVMTDNAKEFITPLTLTTLSKHVVMSDMWDDKYKRDVEHIEVANWANAFIVYPATANIISKFANGIADDTLSTVYLALPDSVRKRIFVFQAMNTNMLFHPATLRNVSRLKGDGVDVPDTRETVLACGDRGFGGLMKPRDAVKYFNERVML